MQKWLLTLIALAVPLFMFFSSSESPHTDELDKKIGQMLNVGFRGMEIEDSEHIARDLQEYHIGGVTLFDYDVPRDTAVRNIESPGQVRRLIQSLQNRSEKPLFVAVDQEGGRVARLKPRYGFPESYSAGELGRIDDPDSTRIYTLPVAESLAKAGFNVNMAPVADLNVNPDNPIIGRLERSFSSDPDRVAAHASAFIDAMHKHDILTVLKHFPGHGSSKDDSHLGMVDVTDTWSEEELSPYRLLIENQQADMIMTAHVFNAELDSTWPATLSQATIDGLLREELGYEGVVISDDMQMEAIRSEYGLKTALRQAIRAGCDILVFANNSIYDPDIIPKAHGLIKELIQEGEISPDRIDSSYKRIMKAKKRL